MKLQEIKEKASNLKLDEYIRATKEDKSYWLFNIRGKFYIGKFRNKFDAPRGNYFKGKPYLRNSQLTIQEL